MPHLTEDKPKEVSWNVETNRVTLESGELEVNNSAP
jgi:hypothetical protein